MDKKTIYKKVMDSVNRNYPYFTEKEKRRVANQLFAKKIVNWQTIGRDSNGKLVIGNKKIKEEK